jgi:hypothetical protein
MEDVGILYGKFIFNGHLVYFVDFIVIWYIYSNFGTLYQDKSGNPGLESHFLARTEQRLGVADARKKALSISGRLCDIIVKARASLFLNERII